MSTTYQDYYKLLGVERGSSDEEIARAFKKLARKYHPDLNPNNKQAEERFKEINEAYEVLKDPEKRRLYDQLGSNWQHGQAFQGNPNFDGSRFHFDTNFDGSGFSDFFESLFGGGRANPFGGAGFGAGAGADPFSAFSRKVHKGRDIESEIYLSLEDVMKGGKRTISVQTSQGPKNLSVTIPQGIAEGKKLRLTGQGESVLNGTNGDLLLQIHYKPHPYFTVQGNDLLCEVPLTPWEAVLGTHASVKTLEGSVELAIPAGTSSGKKFRIRGKGLGALGSRGDMYAKAMIKVPSSINDEERALWSQLAKVSSFHAN